MNPSPPPPPGRSPNIVIWTFAMVVSAVGTWMQKPLVGWLSWELTHSVAWVGTVAMTDVMAALLVGPLGGTLVDRRSPYRVMLTTQVLSAIQAATLTAA